MRALVLVLAAAAALAAPAVRADDDPARLVTILTAPEPQTQLMAMVLTMQAIQQGATVQVMLCGPAGDLALAEPPAAATAPQPPMGMSPRALMEKIAGTGAAVEVCAIYLPGKGLGPEALAPGIGVAKPPAMAAALLAGNARILSF